MLISEFTCFKQLSDESGMITPQPQPTSINNDRLFTSETGQLLDAENFAGVVAKTPLIAIDLIVQDRQKRVLFGMRRNPPAQGFWFVPGGRIYKNETLDAAFSRIAKAELGLNMHRHQSHFTGVFEHFYDINFLGEKGSDTHYVVLAHCVMAELDSIHLPRQQHSEYAWMHENTISGHPTIHPYAKAYFTTDKK